MPAGLSVLVLTAAVLAALLIVGAAWLAARRLRSEALAEAKLAREQAQAARDEATSLRAEALEAKVAAQADLAHVAGLTRDEARSEIEAQVVSEAQAAARKQVRAIEAQAAREAEDKARNAIVTAAQRIALPTSSQSAIAVVRLPSEEMKGRIIGKEGRNIRTFETITGVNLIIDETPELVTLSSFDPERREIAQIAIEQLIADGRIHPQRIEDAYHSALAGAPGRETEAGLKACEEAGVGEMHPELVRLLGTLRLRTSFGQNVLAHLVEAASLGGAVAAELGADEDAVRRAALLHDIGKSQDAAEHGSHAALGASLARRYGESELVVNAIAAHHDEVPAESVEAAIVAIADAASASRPGARRDEAEQYFERISRLEELAASYHGVSKVLAMSSGRDVRVVVEPDQVDDAGTRELARTIARRLQVDGSVPGQIRVTVVRELRAEAIAG